MFFDTYKKIILIGSAGSGKSYMSNKLAEITGLPLIHLDNEFWKPNWEKTKRGEWIEKQNQFINAKEWIIDGNYNSTMELRFAAADLVIFLDINRLVCIWGAIKRHGKKRSDLPDYLEEKFDKEFFDFCKLIWNFKNTDKNKILALHEKYTDKKFITIKNRKEVNNYLEELAKK